MDVNKSPVLRVFESKQRLEVPLFQRQYVWNQENQWEPLWEDIERKFLLALQERQPGPDHFLGAMVLDQQQTPTGHVQVRQIIDGQQRLTTLQIFLAAYRDFCRENHFDQLADEVNQSLQNHGMMDDHEIDQFKVWPTKTDRNQFVAVITAGSYAELMSRFPTKRKKYARSDDPKPKMVEAYFYFYSTITEFFHEFDGEVGAHSLGKKLESCLTALRTSLLVVIIDLDSNDDPQVIFESLNARGQPLLPADLVRNYIFLKAKRSGRDADKLYETYWAHFDDSYWRGGIGSSRSARPRSDVFIQHFLASRQSRDIPIKHLYVEYRHWSEDFESFANVEDELILLSEQSANYRRLLSAEKEDAVGELSKILTTFEVGTVYPLALYLFERNLTPDQWNTIAMVLGSYIIRRSVCGLTTKNYNKLFLTAVREIRTSEDPVTSLSDFLQDQRGDSGLWPTDSQFLHAMISNNVYRLGSSRLIYIISKLNGGYENNMNEQLEFSDPPTVEHIMPQKWREYWPLPCGEKGLDYLELVAAKEDDERVRETINRDDLIHTMGNLTLISRALNASESNLPWIKKRPKLMAKSLLPINIPLQQVEFWDDDRIKERSSRLFDLAKSIWPRG